MKILVIGGTGYLGSHFVEALLKRGDQVICWKRNTSSIQLANDVYKRVTFYEDGVEGLSHKLIKEKVDCIAYLACVYEKTDNHSAVIDTNLILPLEILNIAVECHVEKFLSIGTSLPHNVNLYAQTKRNFAQYGKYYADLHNDFTFIEVLLESFYGADEPCNRFIPATITKLLNNENIDLTEGKQHRDYIHIDDVITGLLQMLDQLHKGSHEVPLGSGVAPTIRELLYYLKEITNSNSDLIFGAKSSRAYEPDCCADLSILNKMGFKLKYPWKEGFLEVVNKLMENKKEGC